MAIDCSYCSHSSQELYTIVVLMNLLVFVQMCSHSSHPISSIESNFDPTLVPILRDV